MELKLSEEAYSSCLSVLLIVPYGIEIISNESIQEAEEAFNRTLWN